MASSRLDALSATDLDWIAAREDRNDRFFSVLFVFRRREKSSDALKVVILARE